MLYNELLHPLLLMEKLAQFLCFASCWDVCHSCSCKGSQCGAAVMPGFRRRSRGVPSTQTVPPPCHHHSAITGNYRAMQDSACVTQLIWNNWKHLSPGLICCMSEYRLCDDLMWERGRAPGRTMALSHRKEGSCSLPGLSPGAGSNVAPGAHPCCQSL